MPSLFVTVTLSPTLADSVVGENIRLWIVMTSPPPAVVVTLGLLVLDELPQATRVKVTAAQTRPSLAWKRRGMLHRTPI